MSAESRCLGADSGAFENLMKTYEYERNLPFNCNMIRRCKTRIYAQQ